MNSFNIPKSASAYSLVDITAAWQDHCDVVESSDDIKVSVDAEGNNCSLKSLDNSSERISTVKIKVPEIIDIHIKSNDLKLQMHNKVQVYIISCFVPIMMNFLSRF